MKKTERGPGAVPGESGLELASPLGWLGLWARGGRLVAIDLPGGAARPPRPRDPADPADAAVLAAARAQLTEYFEGSRQDFDLPLAPEGTEFQRAAWQALLGIPYGETRSYRDQATAMGRPTAVRAVGAANGRNPLPIVIPCHRVVGADGSLTGYGGGLDAKRALLALEGARPRSPALLPSRPWAGRPR